MPEPPDPNAVFKALADPTRRAMLDRLRERDGQSVGELCDSLAMARQSATQHLDLLSGAGLLSVVRVGRERRHYLNPVPFQDIAQRWIAEFERPRLQQLAAIRDRAEARAEECAMTTTDKNGGVPDYVYVTYVRATAEQVWHALTDADLTAAYWGHANVSDWQAGSRWEHRRVDGSEVVDVSGCVVAAEPPTRLVITFEESPGSADAASTVTFLVEPYGDIVRLSVTHERLATAQDRDAVSHGWPAVLANLKSLLETGAVLPQAPWEMPARG